MSGLKNDLNGQQENETRAIDCLLSASAVDESLKIPLAQIHEITWLGSSAIIVEFRDDSGSRAASIEYHSLNILVEWIMLLNPDVVVR